ncbi:hypothetical protein ACFYO1_29455 [Nocardia sp. NPDC006044]|uniref:hypothetical protein n=1 Tax=Nocardia sp. NPDC006044 TaxID=3364306 RepID=UPI0036AB6E18
MTELIEQIEELAREFAASGATAGTLEIHNGGRSGGYGMSCRDVVGALAPVCPDTTVISAAVRAESGVDADDPVRMRLRLSGDSYEFQYCCKSQHYYVREWESARQVVLDPAYRYPGHSIPVLLTDTAPDDRPTSPELVVTRPTWLMSTSSCALGKRTTHRGWVQGTQKRRSPPPRRGSVSGCRKSCVRCIGWRWLASPQATSTTKSRRRIWNTATALSGPGRTHCSPASILRCSSWPRGVVRRISRSPKWVIIGTSDRDVTAVDLDPGPIGVLGR